MIGLLLALAAIASAATPVPLGCAGSVTLATFGLSVSPFQAGDPLPLKSVSQIPGGSHLMWNPVHVSTPDSRNAEVTAVLVPTSGDDLIVFDPRKASSKSEWQLPARPQVIALLFGPEGLSDGKIKSLVTRNPDLLRELAVYAEQSSQVESLIQQLASAEQSGSGTNAILKGFSSQYGVAAPKLDAKASTDQQAAVLLKALLPASNTFDPLASPSVQAQQSGGVAASLAGMFFGNPVALAAGGAALFENLRTAIFPSTDFRSAYVQASAGNEMTLCTKSATPKSKSRTAFLWAYRVPELKKPAVTIAGAPHVPLGSKSTIPVKFGSSSGVKELSSARDWRMTPVSGGAPAAIEVRPTADSLEIDLSKVKVPEGDYHVSATWDWDGLQVGGTLHVHPYSDYAHVTLAPGERDRLIEGKSSVPVKLSGADFEFLEKVALESSLPHAKGMEAEFTLPTGKRAGPQNFVTVNIDTAKRGSYRLLLVQSDGVTHEVPIAVLPPDPKISNLPVRLHEGEEREAIQLQGTGLDRIGSVASEAGVVTGAPSVHGWSGEITLNSRFVKGQKYSLVLKVDGRESPVTVPDGIEIVGPRPRIASVQKSRADALGIAIDDNELPVGNAMGLVLSIDHLDDHKRPKLELGCDNGESRRSLTLSAGEPSSGATLTFSGPGALYLSLDPGLVGYAGCRLTATAVVDPEGRSEPFLLGRVIRVPELDKFTLTTEKVGDSSYAGILEGRDLDVIEKVGWDALKGVPVESIPTPKPSDSTHQTLRVVLPWPAPAPHAPLYVWLRGGEMGRKTTVAY